MRNPSLKYDYVSPHKSIEIKIDVKKQISSSVASEHSDEIEKSLALTTSEKLDIENQCL